MYIRTLNSSFTERHVTINTKDTIWQIEVSVFSSYWEHSKSYPVLSTNHLMAPEAYILEAALDKDLDAPYSCQGGICSSCLARVTEGAATMRMNSILNESEINEGLILTCQAHPTTPKIVLDFDDV